MSRLTRRHQAWALSENDQGLWSVLHGERPAFIDLASRQVALSFLRDLHVGGERVFQSDRDGYRTEITKELTRMGIINATMQGVARRPTGAERWAALAADRRAKRKAS